MAVTSEQQDSRFTLILQTGLNDSGHPVFKSKSFNRVKPSVDDEIVYAVANALAELQVYPLSSIERINTHILEEE